MADRPGMMVGEKEHTVIGERLVVGQDAPDFELVANDFSTRTLSSYSGKVKVISTFISIDMDVCSAQTRRFNKEAASLGDNIVVLSVSADLPFALRRFCANEGIENTETLSTHKDMNFAEDYGVYDTDWRICQRGLFVISKDNIVHYAEYVPVIGQEVAFDKGLEKAKSLI